MGIIFAYLIKINFWEANKFKYEEKYSQFEWKGLTKIMCQQLK